MIPLGRQKRFLSSQIGRAGSLQAHFGLTRLSPRTSGEGSVEEGATARRGAAMLGVRTGDQSSPGEMEVVPTQKCGGRQQLQMPPESCRGHDVKRSPQMPLCETGGPYGYLGVRADPITI